MNRALECRPDIILLDACMPGLSGFEATKQLKKLLPTVKVILVTMLTEAISISEAFRAGVSGYVLKQSASDELRAAIDSVLANKRFLSKDIDPEVRETVEHEWFRPEGYSSDLTGRQREIRVASGGPHDEAYFAATQHFHEDGRVSQGEYHTQTGCPHHSRSH